MTARPAPLLALLLAALAPRAAAAAGGPAPTDEDGPARFSLPTADDVTAWTRPGFRVQLGVASGRLFGLEGAPSGWLIGPLLRLGLRLDEGWSLLGSFQYLLATESGGLSGLRFAGTIEPTLHFSRRGSLAIGLGFGGLVEGATGRPQPEPLPDQLESSYTFADASPPIARCSGVGVVGLVRVDWQLVLGPRTATGFAVELGGQYTGCADDTGRVEPDTAEPIVRRQFWPHLGLSLAWVVSWR